MKILKVSYTSFDLYGDEYESEMVITENQLDRLDTIVCQVLPEEIDEEFLTNNRVSDSVYELLNLA